MIWVRRVWEAYYDMVTRVWEAYCDMVTRVWEVCYDMMGDTRRVMIWARRVWEAYYYMGDTAPPGTAPSRLSEGEEGTPGVF